MRVAFLVPLGKAMQIYELTQQSSTLNEANTLSSVTGAAGSAVAGVKNIGTAIASPFRDAGAAYSQATSGAKLNAWTDKAYRAWEGYVAKRLLPMDQAQQAAYVNGQDGKMKQDLLSFVQKNFFSNLDINNITNKQEVMSVIDSMVPAAQTPAPTTTQTPNFGTSGYAGQTTNAPTGMPATKTQMPTNMIPRTAPAPAVTATANVPKQNPTGRTTPGELAKAQAKWAAAAKQQPVTEAINKQGFLKLAQLAATAQQPTGRPRSAAPTPPGTQPVASIGSIIQKSGINPAILQTLGQTAIAALAQNNDSANSTGNPAADALLKSLGFTVQ